MYLFHQVRKIFSTRKSTINCCFDVSGGGGGGDGVVNMIPRYV
jgi:hypothetical protein